MSSHAIPKVEVEFPDATDVATWGDPTAEWGDPTREWDGSATFVDIGPWARGATVKRGRQHELGRVEAGVTEMRLEDEDRRFDPVNAASPYHPHVRPMRRLRITATHGGVTHPVSTGWVEGWPVKWDPMLFTADVDITAADAFKELALQDLHAERKAERTSDRIHYLLDRAGWPTSRRQIEPGAIDMPERSYEGTSLLVALQEAAASEGGVVFVSRAGDVVFHNRHHRVANMQTSLATFGGAAGLGYDHIEPVYDDNELANEVRATIGSGEQFVATDAGSQGKYGRRVLELGELKLANPYVAQDTVDYQVDRRADPDLHFRGIRLVPTVDPDLWHSVLTLDIGDRITIVLEPAVGDPIVREAHLEHVTHRVTSHTWVTDWVLSPADERHFWQLDTDDSVLDSTARVGF